MSNVPSSLSQKPSLTTLNGIFGPPKMNHRRDFLRENKLKVKGAQPKPTTVPIKRSNAQKPQPSNAAQKRGDPQQRGIKESVRPQPRNGINNNQLPTKPAKSFCSKQIQTDDIHDREFLYEALQRCTGGDGEPQQEYAEQYVDRYGNHVDQLDIGDGDGDHAAGGYNYDNEQAQMQQEQLSARSYRSRNSNQQAAMPAKSTSRSHMTNGQTGRNMLPIQEDALSNHFDNLSLHQPEEETYQPPHTGRSRIASNRSSGSVNLKMSPSQHRAGNLPRYLEREKREKEEELLRQQQQDPNCPLGYHLLTEQERLGALAAADKQFKNLISELNHMPMTTKTMRIQARKNEIERELCALENDIRLFSKPKVYVKQETGN